MYSLCSFWGNFCTKFVCNVPSIITRNSVLYSCWNAPIWKILNLMNIRKASTLKIKFYEKNKWEGREWLYMNGNSWRIAILWMHREISKVLIPGTELERVHNVVVIDLRVTYGWWMVEFKKCDSMAWWNGLCNSNVHASGQFCLHSGIYYSSCGPLSVKLAGG